MVNAHTPIAQPEDWKINLDDAWQVLWWCRYLGLTKSQLESAVAVAGTAIIDVKRHVDRQQAGQPPRQPVKAPAGAGPVMQRTALSRSPF